MVALIDRRNNPTGKNLPNRQRYLRRAGNMLKEAAQKTLANDPAILDGADAIQVTVRGIEEWRLSTEGGNHRYVLPGNKAYVKGDEIPRGQQGPGSPAAGGIGKAIEELRFVLSREEYLSIIFGGQALPNLTKRSLGKTKETKPERSGYSRSGAPSSLDRRLTMQNSLARRRAQRRPSKRQMLDLKRQLGEAERFAPEDVEKIRALREKIERMQARRNRIPFIDPDQDMRYKHRSRVSKPSLKAAMICVMDVSDSMTAKMKELAKLFYLLLNVFLAKNYRDVEIAFIRHTDTAEEVDQHTFFYGKETGGTIVSEGLAKALEIIRKRYASGWNVYCAQVSDGDNPESDAEKTTALLGEILAAVQYFAYAQVSEKEPKPGANLWKAYGAVTAPHFYRCHVAKHEDVLARFMEMFGKERLHSG